MVTNISSEDMAKLWNTDSIQSIAVWFPNKRLKEMKGKFNELKKHIYRIDKELDLSFACSEEKRKVKGKYMLGKWLYFATTEDKEQTIDLLTELRMILMCSVSNEPININKELRDRESLFATLRPTSKYSGSSIHCPLF